MPFLILFSCVSLKPEFPPTLYFIRLFGFILFSVVVWGVGGGFLGGDAHGAAISNRGCPRFFSFFLKKKDFTSPSPLLALFFIFAVLLLFSDMTYLSAWSALEYATKPHHPGFLKEV